jgi:hypothetical protein
MKRPTPSDLATLGSLDAHAASKLMFLTPAVALQTTRSPARIVGTLHANTKVDAGDGAEGVPPHPDAIKRPTLKKAIRLTRTRYVILVKLVSDRRPAPRRWS